VWLDNSYIERVFNSYPLSENKLTVESVGKIFGKCNGKRTNNDCFLFFPTDLWNCSFKLL
jgi:hypothetical protein